MHDLAMHLELSQKQPVLATGGMGGAGGALAPWYFYQPCMTPCCIQACLPKFVGQASVRDTARPPIVLRAAGARWLDCLRST